MLFVIIDFRKLDEVDWYNVTAMGRFILWGDQEG